MREGPSLIEPDYSWVLTDQLKRVPPSLQASPRAHPTLVQVCARGSKKKKIWLWTALNHYQPGILAITVGDRSGKTFANLWEKVENWGSKWYMTDGYCVYANFIDPALHLVMKKTKMTRVEGENTRRGKGWTKKDAPFI